MLNKKKKTQPRWIHKCYVCGNYELNSVTFLLNQESSYCLLSLIRCYGKYWLLIIVVVPAGNMHIGAKKFPNRFLHDDCWSGRWICFVSEIFTSIKRKIHRKFLYFLFYWFLPYSPTCKLTDEDPDTRGPTWTFLSSQIWIRRAVIFVVTH